MRFNEHTRLTGLHAFLSASSPHWVNYEEEKLVRVFHERMTAKRGSELHAFAKEAIRLKIWQIDNGQTLNSYINDGIGFRMTPEVTLSATPNCFGTADTISFDEKTNLLRVHDLKNGVHEASMEQLRLYAAMFCIEYGYRPSEIQTKLRIYQNDAIKEEEPTQHDLNWLISRIRTSDAILEECKKEAM